MRPVKRLGLIAGGASIAVLSVASPALANWESKLTGVPTGFESRRWTDQDYSQVHFITCDTTQSTSQESTDIRLQRVVNDAPDVAYDTKHFTACFSHGDGDEVSSASWTGLPYSATTIASDGDLAGGYYFQIMKINGYVGDVPSLWVDRVVQDTSLADGN